MMASRRRRDRGGQYNFWPVYSDIALSMVLLLLLVVLAQQIRTLLETDVQATIVTLRQAGMAAALAGLPVTSSVDGNTQVIVLSTDLLFVSDSADLRPEGRDLILRVYHRLVAAKIPFTRISVEGHADHQRSGLIRPGDLKQDGGNWRLSAERAVQVAQLLQTFGMQPEKLEVVGRSYYAPADSGYLQNAPGKRGRREAEYQASLQHNRRITLRIFYSTREART
jgi:flagellar motor protein MotB